MEVDLGEDFDDASPENQHRPVRQDVFDTLSYEVGERFLGVTEWFPNLDNKEYHLLVVNTIIKAEKNKSPTGRLLLLKRSSGRRPCHVGSQEGVHASCTCVCCGCSP